MWNVDVHVDKLVERANLPHIVFGRLYADLRFQKWPNKKNHIFNFMRTTTKKMTK